MKMPNLLTVSKSQFLCQFNLTVYFASHSGAFDKLPSAVEYNRLANDQSTHIGKSIFLCKFKLIENFNFGANLRFVSNYIVEH